jgi:very-short-patch-repair endonuclease
MREENPSKYDIDRIVAVVEKNSYIKSSKILGLHMPHIKTMIIESGRHDLLPAKSSYERLISQFLEQNNIEYRTNCRKLIAPNEIDFVIDSHRIAIEVNGLRWHSEMFGKRGRRYHLEKTMRCDEMGYRLIHIFNDEIDNYTDTVFSILRSALGIKKSVLYARQCTVMELTYTDVKDFLENTHLQGAYPASKYYGLYTTQGVLVSVMTFKKIGSGEYELSRYCIHNEYTIHGAAHRLFKMFLKNINDCDRIITYSDRRFFNGGLYSKLGFNHVYDTQPNYWYLTRGSERREHRLKYTKQKLVKDGYDPSMTEWEIMQCLGRDRIWDCGHSKWVYEVKK